MNGFLVDTNCISELVRPRPDPGVVEWFEAADEGLLYLSVLTLGEIRKGIAGLSQTKRRTVLETWLEVDLRARFAGRLLSIDEAVANRWGLLAAQAKRKGKPIAVIDAMIAATAQHYNLTIVTRNVDDYAEVPVPVLNPWDS